MCRDALASFLLHSLVLRFAGQPFPASEEIIKAQEAKPVELSPTTSRCARRQHALCGADLLSSLAKRLIGLTELPLALLRRSLRSPSAL